MFGTPFKFKERAKDMPKPYNHQNTTLYIPKILLKQTFCCRLANC